MVSMLHFFLSLIFLSTLISFDIVFLYCKRKLYDYYFECILRETDT